MFRSANRPDQRPCPVTQQRCVRGCPGECRRIRDRLDQPTRRRFIFLGTAAAAAVVAAPLVELAEPPVIHLMPSKQAIIDGILKEYYGPAVADQINRPTILLAHYTVKAAYERYVEAENRYADSDR